MIADDLHHDQMDNRYSTKNSPETRRPPQEMRSAIQEVKDLKDVCFTSPLLMSCWMSQHTAVNPRDILTLARTKKNGFHHLILGIHTRAHACTHGNDSRCDTSAGQIEQCDRGGGVDEAEAIKPPRNDWRKSHFPKLSLGKNEALRDKSFISFIAPLITRGCKDPYLLDVCFVGFFFPPSCSLFLHTVICVKIADF